MKKLLLVILLVHNIFALDSVSAIPETQKEVVTNIIKVLKLPSNERIKEMIFDKLSFAFEDGWSAHWTTNSSGANSKIENSKTQICDVTIYNNNRVANITFVYFKKEEQLFITIKQYVDGDSKIILKAYKERKNNTDYSIENETDNYAYFQEKGHMSYITYHISAPAGMVVYEDSFILNVK